MRYIPVTELRGGEILANNIINSNMQVLIREETVITDKMIQRIKRLGIKSIYIEDHDMQPFLKDCVMDTIDTTIRNHSINKVKKSIEEFQGSVDKQKKTLKYSDSGSELFTSIKNISTDLVNEVLSAKSTSISMLDIKSVSDYYYEHSVNITVLSLIIGTEMGLSTDELESLAFGALLVDIGCNWLDKEVLLKESELDSSEFEKVKDHVQLGFEYITKNTIFNAHVKSIIMHHHERIDGSGYPSGLKGDNIHKLAKIVMVADVYDALTSDRPYRRAYNQHEAIEYIMGRAGSLFDFDIANIFSRKVIPYPVGTYVKLSNNQKGVITENNSNHPLRPVIRTFGESKYTSETSFQIDLLEVNNVTIEKVIYDLG